MECTFNFHEFLGERFSRRLTPEISQHLSERHECVIALWRAGTKLNPTFPRLHPNPWKSYYPFPRQENGIPSAAMRWPDFGDRSSFGRPFSQYVRHSGRPLLSFSPGRRFSRPTPERVFAVDHRSGSEFSGIGPSILPPRPVGT